LEGERVVLSFDATCTDVYGRTLAYVWLSSAVDTAAATDGVLVNEWMLENGYARLFDEEWVDPLRLQQRLEDAEAGARARGLGLWACPESP
jgi:endonuclease YncB( thermonuclease family)